MRLRNRAQFFPYRLTTRCLNPTHISSVTMGATIADMVLKVKASSTYVIDIPKGLPFTYLSFACTANANPADNTAPGGNLVVNIVAS